MNLKKRYGLFKSGTGRLEKRFFKRCPVIIQIALIFVCASVLPKAVSAQQEAASPAAAQPAPMRISPDEAVQLAFKNNLSLETSRSSTAVKKRASDYSWNQFIPSITASGSLMVDNEATTNSGIAPVMEMPLNAFSKDPLPSGTPNIYGVVPYSIDVPQWRIAGSIQASVTVSAAMFENMKRLRLDYEGGLITYEKARAQLERDVRKAYHNILLLQENISLLRGSYENIEQQVQMAQANYDAGLAPELTLLQARVARENMRPAIDQAENGLRLSMAQFAMFLGIDFDTQFELVPVDSNTEFISIDTAEMISKAASKKPDIQELRQTILMLKSARKAQIYSLTPSLSLSWNSNSIFTPFDDAKFGNKDDWNNSGSFTVSLGLRLHSLIPFSQDFQAIKDMDDQITQAALGLAQMVRGTEIEVYNTVLTLEQIRISAEAQRQTVQLAEQSFRLTQQAYQAGLQDYYQVQSAQQSLDQARVQMLEQQFNYLNGLLDLEYSIGVPFGTLSRN